jgi:protein-glutamine gamma-glutamyltransferase
LDLTHRINLSLAVMAVLSATLVGLGQPNLFLPAGMALAAAASLWFCDRLGQIVIDGWVVNMAVLGTAAVAVWRFAQVGGAPDAAVAAEALIGLQAVMLFERKTARTHWDLFSLSLLQTFLACAFHHGPMFGAVLVVYLFFVLATLVLLGMRRQQQRCESQGLAGNSQAAHEAGLRTDWLQVAGVGVATLIVGPLSLYLRLHPFSARQESPDSGTDATDKVSRASSSGVATVLREPLLLPPVAAPSGDQAGWEFWKRIGGLTFVSLLIGAGIFAATPRFGGVNLSLIRGGGRTWASAPISLQRTVGYDDQVQLGELGATLDNTQKVLAVRFRRQRDGAPYRVYGNLFLRGAVLNQYSEGRWQYAPGPLDAPAPVSQSAELDGDRHDSVREVIRQEFRLEPLDRPELFCVWPSIHVGRDSRVQFDWSQQRFQRSTDAVRRPFSYEMATAELVDGQQTDLAPALSPVDLQPLLAWSPESFPALAALAEQWMGQADVPVDDPIGRARVLERALRSSPRFSYRLGEQRRDQTLDPIEDFIVNDPRGHCEYFAAALALMLRSQGLPSRVVVGFKTDEYNQFDERYWARQSHAHAWVEAYIPPESLPDPVRGPHPLFDWSHGGWLRLDPTPSSLDELALSEYLKQKWRDWRAAIQTAWTQHVMQMSGTRQDSLVYRPLLDTLRQTAARLSGVRSAGGEFSGTPRQMLMLALPWLLGGTLASAALAWWALRRQWFTRAGRGRAGAAWGRGGSHGQEGKNVEFYRRWEAVFRRWGLDRHPCQTPREFAGEAGGRLAELAGQPHLRQAANRVIDAFYEVRFGGATLDDQQTADVEQALQHIQQAARRTSSNGT